MELQQLTEQMLVKRYLELGSNFDEFVKEVATLILKPDAEQLKALEDFRKEAIKRTEAVKSALEAEKLVREDECTKQISALKGLANKVKKN